MAKAKGKSLIKNKKMNVREVKGEFDREGKFVVDKAIEYRDGQVHEINVKSQERDEQER